MKEGELGGKPHEGREEDVEAEVCFICASPVIHNSIAPCNHRTCHICALRLRALYKTRACAHCRVGCPSIVTFLGLTLTIRRQRLDLSYLRTMLINATRTSPTRTF